MGIYQNINVIRYSEIMQLSTFKLNTYSFCFLTAVAPEVSVVEPSEKGRVVVTEGTGLKLKCRFTGAPTPRVVWLKDGLPLRPDFRLRVKDKR